MTRHFTCNAFSDLADNEIDFESIFSNEYYSRTFSQKEVVLKIDHLSKIPEYVKAVKEGHKGVVPFIPRDVEYTVSYHNLGRLQENPDRIPALIPTKDNLDLLGFTLENLRQYGVDKSVLPVIIDDRSQNSKEIEQLANQYGAVLVRVIYHSDAFNFSMINNLAAWLLYHAGKKDMILWNSDLWVDNRETIPDIIQQYQDYKERNPSVAAAGTKLVYPQEDFCDLLDSDKFISSMAADFNKPEEVVRENPPFGTVQFGGSCFCAYPFFSEESSSPVLLSPAHYGRFLQPDNEAVNIDKSCSFITGAFQILDLSVFYEIGGLNPSMDMSMQDIDYCMKLNTVNKVVYYFGRDKHLLHAESMTLSSKTTKEGKNNKNTMSWKVRQLSNEMLYAIKWNEYVYAGKMLV